VNNTHLGYKHYSVGSLSPEDLFYIIKNDPSKLLSTRKTRLVNDSTVKENFDFYEFYEKLEEKREIKK